MLRRRLQWISRYLKTERRRNAEARERRRRTVVKNKKTTTTTGRELFASVAWGMEEERKREKEREYDRGMRMKDSKNEETKEPTSVVAMETGPDLLASLKELGPST